MTDTKPTTDTTTEPTTTVAPVSPTVEAPEPGAATTTRAEIAAAFNIDASLVYDELPIAFESVNQHSLRNLFTCGHCGAVVLGTRQGLHETSHRIAAALVEPEAA